jgi:biopolymer transport protein ExbD
MKRKFDTKVAEGDMTAMIDMVFQLIIFFMVLINFSQEDQNQAIKLPSSELAQPAEAPLEHPIVLNLDFNGTVFMGAETSSIAGLRPLLQLEADALKAKGHSAKDANIIIRAHQKTAGGMVQELIKKCQEVGFEKFVLRAQEDRS